MDIERIRELRLADPFRQFYIILNDGKRLFIDEPYHLAIAADGSHFMASPKGIGSHRFVAAQVKDVDVPPQQTRRAG